MLFAKSISALALVCLLIFVCLLILKKLTNKDFKFKEFIKKSNFEYVDQLILSNKAKLMHVKKNNKNYVFIVGDNNHLLVDKYEEV